MWPAKRYAYALKLNNMEYTFNQLLKEIADGKRQVVIELPNTEPIKAIITDINLETPNWKPFKVKIITEGLTITDTRWTESEWGGDVLEEYQRPYTEDRIMVEFITHIDFEEGKQLTIVC